eukprot:UN11164
MRFWTLRHSEKPEYSIILLYVAHGVKMSNQDFQIGI